MDDLWGRYGSGWRMLGNRLDYRQLRKNPLFFHTPSHPQRMHQPTTNVLLTQHGLGEPHWIMSPILDAIRS